MEAYLSNEGTSHEPVLSGQVMSNFKVTAAGKTYQVVSVEKSSFTVPAQCAPKLTGMVDLYQGKTHLGLCLITGSRLVGEEVRFSFKRTTPFAQEAADALESSAARPFVLITDALSDFQ